MATQVPTKIVLKSTTKMSLNDRFTTIQQQVRPQPQPTVQNIRSNMVAQQQASAANRRLAQQLANRPTLNNMVNPYPDSMNQMNMPSINMPMNMMQQQPMQQQRSLKQRLGRGNIKARLNLDAVGRGGGGGMGNMMGRGNWGMQRGYTRGGRGQGVSMGQNQRGRGRGSNRGMTFSNSTSPRGLRGRGRGTMRGNFNRGGRGGGQGQFRGGRGGGFRGRGRGRGGNMRGGRGRGRGGAGGGDSVSKEQLDNQLDEYMSKTKSYLNAELDSYMAEANP